ncbi:integral membrane protein [Piedraia hortae CBS 480.64]|uniref:Integral membrane protein n=1 Tax=Piedraia hortae CBS 480.64 TaxID=1314780 RepID=A0A6A7C1J4_9PEZI|nr:integral membrane protein [Piedraia hortae CBS 480.64]
MANNGTDTQPDLGRPQSAARLWFEPLIVCLMLGSLILNRRRTIKRPADGTAEHLLQIPTRDESDGESTRSASPMKSQQQQQRLCCLRVEVPDTKRFANNLHSRILQKYPFLIEMFYWALNYIAYSMTKKVAAAVYGRGGHQVTAMAQDNGINILQFEHASMFSIFFLVKEVQVQQFFLRHHRSIMTFFNQIYSLVHIPGTVAFLSWYYYAAPNHETFAVARRTMTLGNFCAFIIFCFYPCMPPRLLPEEFGFKDTVRQEHAESVWVGGSDVNQLAAMPSLHFTYAFVIGCTFFYHSGLLQALAGKRTPNRSSASTIAYILAAVLYPTLVLTVIVATANHYYLDAVVATFSVTLAFLCNRVWLVLLPAEGLLAWVLRLKKPEPTTGQRLQNESRKAIVV